MPRLVPDESDEKLLRPASVSEKERVNDEKYASPHSREKRERVNGEKNASPRSEKERGRTTRGMPRLVLNGKRREDASPRFR